jgi:hypothetical protein
MYVGPMAFGQKPGTIFCQKSSKISMFLSLLFFLLKSKNFWAKLCNYKSPWVLGELGESLSCTVFSSKMASVIKLFTAISYDFSY